MSYLTYDEYQNYGGSLEEPAFERIAFKASKRIDNVTFGRLKNETVISEAVKRLMYELIGIISNNDYSNEDYTPTVSSEGNDGYSMSLASGTVMTIELANETIDNLITEYLSEECDSYGTPLLYCGY